MYLFVNFLIFFSFTQTFESKNLKNFVQSNRKPVAKLCKMMESKNLTLPSTSKQISKIFIKKHPVQSRLFISQLVNTYGSNILKNFGYKTFPWILIKTSKTQFIIPKSSSGFIDLGNFIKNSDFPVSVEILVKSTKKSIINLSLTNWKRTSIVVNGTKKKLSDQNNFLEINIPKGVSKITLTPGFFTKPVFIAFKDNHYFSFPDKNITSEKINSKPVSKLKIKDFNLTKACNNTKSSLSGINILKSYGLPYSYLSISDTKYINSVINIAKHLRKNSSNSISLWKNLINKYPNGLIPSLLVIHYFEILGLHKTALVFITNLQNKYGDIPILKKTACQFSKKLLNNPKLCHTIIKNEYNPNEQNLHALSLIKSGESESGFKLLAKLFKQQGILQSLVFLADYSKKNNIANSIFLKFPEDLRKQAITLLKPLKKHSFVINSTLDSILKIHLEKNIPSKFNFLTNKIIQNYQVLFMNKNGSSDYFREIIYGIGDPVSANKHRIFSTRFSPSTQYFKLLNSDIFHADGTKTLNAASVDFYSINNIKSRIYFDLREIKMKLPTLKKGDIIKIAWRIRNLPTEKTFGKNFFGTIFQFQEFVPIKKSEVHIYYPDSIKVSFFMKPSKLVTRYSSHKNHLFHFSFVGRDIPGIKIEPAMPGWGESIMNIQVGTGKSWKNIGKTYWDLIKKNYKLTKSIIKLSKSITKNSKTRTEKIQAIHKYTLNHFRYVSMMFGLHSYLPYTVDEILERGFGDCKDMSLILTLLLKASGIKAWPAAMRTRILGNFDFKTPSLSPFDHSIVYLPDDKQWLDTTTKNIMYPKIPAHIQGRQALVISPQGGILMKTPLSSYKDNIEVSNMNIEVAKSSTLIFETVSIQGEGESGWRTLLKSKVKKLKWHYFSQDIKNIKFDVKNLNSLKSPIKIKSKAKIKSFLKKSGKLYFINIGFYEKNILKKLHPSTIRKNDLLIDFPGIYKRKIKIKLPSDFCPLKLPKSFSINSSQLDFYENISHNQNSILINRVLKLKKWRIKAQKYSKFKKNAEFIENNFQKKIYFQKCR